MSESVLVIGSGGREHAIVWKLLQSSKVGKVYVSPGSDALESLPHVIRVDLGENNHLLVAQYCKDNRIGLVIVGPEGPLDDGIADVLRRTGIRVFGPDRLGARLESDKIWSKGFMDKYNIPTARWKSFSEATLANHYVNTAPYPAWVVKANGLAGGKGVVVGTTKSEACTAVDEALIGKKFGEAGEEVVVEELLTGEEVSVLAFCDGTTVLSMLPTQDHKRIYDGDLGPNTGGMGAYCPCPLLDRLGLRRVEETILKRTLSGLLEEGIHYVGVIYAGLMLTEDGPKVLEFNCRFGDPETEVILPLLESDLYDVCLACTGGTLSEITLEWKPNLSAVGVVLASRGYPESSEKGKLVTGVETIQKRKNYIIFHSGTEIKDREIYTNGGRVLIVVALAAELAVAASRATIVAMNDINFDGKQFRSDIAHRGISKSILRSGSLTYKAAGVDITTGNNLVRFIMPAARSTNRPGNVGALGGFAGVFDTRLAGFEDPYLVSGTDGVGTKLKVAQALDCHESIGIDLVAMCVNDVLAHGAEPLFFLDYLACGRLDVEVAREIVRGVAEGCRRAGCVLIGGETAEMPDMYSQGEYDLAGFTVGAVEKTAIIPKLDSFECFDVVIGLPSNGIHSNGFSLVRKVMTLNEARFTDTAPFSPERKSFGEEFLKPTKIYVKELLPVIRTGKVKAFAHITGGGLLENIPRVLPKDKNVVLDATKWTIPPVFAWLAATGGISDLEMLRTFNCGIGGIIIVDKSDASEILPMLSPLGARRIGEVTCVGGAERVTVKHFADVMEPMMNEYVPKMMEQLLIPKKRVAVLISGEGTNLQALINATLDPTALTDSEIVLVISNRSNVEGLKRAERAGIPTAYLNHREYPTRESYDSALHNVLTATQVDIVCLAGFMRILSEDFTKRWRGKLINIHPSLLPLFKGTDAIKQALDAGVRVTGATVHFVNAEVDAGAILTQEAVQIDICDTVERLALRVHAAEHRIYPEALRLLASGTAVLKDDNTVSWLTL